MIKIFGEREINHHPHEVFEEGLNSGHWEGGTDNLYLQPYDEVLEKGSLVEVRFNLSLIRVRFDAEVTECIQDRHVALEGSAKGFGDTRLHFDLELLKKNKTAVRYGFEGDLHAMGRLARVAAEASAGKFLHVAVDSYANELTKKISDAISGRSKKAA